MKLDSISSIPGARLVSTDDRVLPLKSVGIEASAGGGIARTTIRHTFHNPFEEPLEVVYKTALPADAAVTGYGFVVGERRIEGQVRPVEEARQAYEEALIEGRTSVLLEEERSALFTQTVGNVPPGVQVVAELSVDHPLSWRLAEGGWEWRMPTTLGPRYLGAPGAVDDPERVSVDVADGPTGVGVTLTLRIDEPLAEGGRPGSPSHRLEVTPDGDSLVVTFADGDVVPDRDLVVRWPVAAAEPGVTIRTARPAADADHADSAYALVTLTPPVAEGHRAVARDLIVLLDTSGSMSGAPLDQARRVVAGLVGSLGPDDRLELIEFSTRARRWRPEPALVTPKAKRSAHKWIAGLEAGGATEMVEAIEAALAPLDADRARQVVLVSDGYVGFEERVVRHVRARLPKGSTLHCVGVGSAINRTLTRWAARAGRGREVLVGLGEDGERAAAEVVAATDQPVVTDVSVSGSAVRTVAPRVATDLLAGAPVVVALELDPGGGEVLVRGRTAEGVFERRQWLSPVAHGEGAPAVTALVGRERVADLELDGLVGRVPHDTDERIEELGLAFGLATRRTAWLAIDPEAAVDGRAPLRMASMPHELAHGLSAEGLGLRSPRGVFELDTSGICYSMGAFSPPPPPEDRRQLRFTPAKLRKSKSRQGYRDPGWAAVAEPLDDLSGVFLWTAEGLVLLVTVVDAMSWVLPDEVEIHFADDPVDTAPVVAERSTAAGEVPAGARLLVALDFLLDPDAQVRGVQVGEIFVRIHD